LYFTPEDLMHVFSFSHAFANAGVLLPLVAVTWAFAFLAVSEDENIFKWLFAAFDILTVSVGLY